MTARRETSAVFSLRDQCSNVKLSDAKLLLFVQLSRFGLEPNGQQSRKNLMMHAALTQTYKLLLQVIRTHASNYIT